MTITNLRITASSTVRSLVFLLTITVLTVSAGVSAANDQSPNPVVQEQTILKEVPDFSPNCPSGDSTHCVFGSGTACLFSQQATCVTGDGSTCAMSRMISQMAALCPFPAAQFLSLMTPICRS